jgi:ACR3 family arsenite transporter
MSTDPENCNTTNISAPCKTATPLSQLPWLDRLLSLWIFLAMALGVLLGYFVPSAQEALNSGSIAEVSIPIFVGLLWMMYPVLW